MPYWTLMQHTALCMCKKLPELLPEVYSYLLKKVKQWWGGVSLLDPVQLWGMAALYSVVCVEESRRGHQVGLENPGGKD